MRPLFLGFLRFVSHPAVAIGGALIIALGAAGIAYHLTAVTPSGDYTAAVVAPITQSAGATSDLSFQVSGKVVAVEVQLGATVAAGTTLVELDHSALSASLAGANANLENAQANLAGLQAGTRPEQITVDQTAVDQAQAALADSVRASYVNADDAIYNKVDQLFSNPRTSSATLIITVPDSALANEIQSERIALEPVLEAWGASVDTSTATTAQANLTQIGVLLDNIAAALAETPSSTSLPAATLAAYQANVNTARLNISGSLTALTSAQSAQLNAQGTLTLAQAPATASQLAAAQAGVDAAQAAIEGIQVQINQTVLTAPIAGVVTAQNAELGETVAPGQELVSLASEGASTRSALVVPASAVITTNGASFVYVKNASGAPTKTVVTTGVTSGSMTEITSGLSAGQDVLTFGASQ